MRSAVITRVNASTPGVNARSAWLKQMELTPSGPHAFCAVVRVTLAETECNVLPFTPERGGHFALTLEQRLADLGYVEGRNIALIHRLAGPQPDKLQEAIVSLVQQADLLVVWGPIAGIAAKKLAGDVPTVCISISFPVEIGLVQSLAHPGGNMTGIAAEAASETYGKRLQILKEIVPDLKRVAVLSPIGDPNVGFDIKSLGLAAHELGVTLLPVDITSI